MSETYDLVIIGEPDILGDRLAVPNVRDLFFALLPALAYAEFEIADDFHAGFAESPDLSIKIRHPLHLLLINGNNNITGLDSGLFRGAA